MTVELYSIVEIDKKLEKQKSNQLSEVDKINKRFEKIILQDLPKLLEAKLEYMLEVKFEKYFEMYFEKYFEIYFDKYFDKHFDEKFKETFDTLDQRYVKREDLQGKIDLD